MINMSRGHTCQLRSGPSEVKVLPAVPTVISYSFSFSSTKLESLIVKRLILL